MPDTDLNVHKRPIGTTVKHPFVASKYFFKSFVNPLDNNSYEMGINGASTPVSFRVGGLTTEQIYIYRVNLFIIDTTIVPTKFGGIAELSNGVTIKIKDANDATLVDFMDGGTIKHNAEFGLLNGTDGVISAGADSFSIRWSLDKSGGPLWLLPGEYMEILIQDDLTGLVEFRAMAQGIVEEFN